MSETVYVLKFKGVDPFEKKPVDMFYNGHGGITKRLAMALRFETADHARHWRAKVGEERARVAKVVAK